MRITLLEAIQVSLRIIRIYLHYRKTFLTRQIESGIHGDNSSWELTKQYLIDIPTELFVLLVALHFVLIQRFNPFLEPEFPKPENQLNPQVGTTLKRG